MFAATLTYIPALSLVFTFCALKLQNFYESADFFPFTNLIFTYVIVPWCQLTAMYVIKSTIAITPYHNQTVNVNNNNLFNLRLQQA